MIRAHRLRSILRRRVLLWVVEHADPVDMIAVVDTASERLHARAGVLGPPREVVARAVVADGYAQGRADLQFTHRSAQHFRRRGEQ